MRPRALALVVTALTAAATAGLTGCGSDPPPAPAARAFLADWERGDTAAAAARTDSDPGQVRGLLDATATALGATGRRLALGAVTRTDDGATAAYQATVTLAGLGEWRYDGTVPLTLAGERWRVRWSPAVVHPDLREGEVFVVTRTLPARAPVLDGAGAPLVTAGPVVTVGVEPRRLVDRAATVATVAAVTGVDAARLDAAVTRAKPDAFVEAITLRQAAYDAVRPRLQPLPGVVVRAGTRQLAPSDTFARGLLGRVGPATAEALERAGPLYRTGDELGLGGLQGALQTRLAGTPSGTISITGPAGAGARPVGSVAGVAPAPVATTLDRRVQEAADAALAAVPAPGRAALVAVRPSDAAVLAVANRPADGTELALSGRYPPGSTFKVVSTVALLATGLSPDEPVPCPPTATVGGRTFRNFEGESAGAPSFRTDFAISCNTAFTALSRRLDGARLAAAARGLGIGVDPGLPVPSYGGEVPEPRDATDLAASVIGQGRVLVSPLVMAGVAAAVASGTWRPPVLLRDPAPAGPPATPVPLAGAEVLRSLMAGVVTAGTAAGAGLPPGTGGKTGTPEFGAAVPPATHAWFIGFRGDLAVAVLVEGGGVGGRVAAPLAADFLRRLAG